MTLPSNCQMLIPGIRRPSIGSTSIQFLQCSPLPRHRHLQGIFRPFWRACILSQSSLNPTVSFLRAQCALPARILNPSLWLGREVVLDI